MIKPALVFLLFLATGWWNDITRISRINRLKTEAESAFKQKEYNLAAKAWAEVLAETGAPDPAVRLNLAHAYYLQNQTLKAAREYQQVVRTAPPQLRSVAQQQLGNQLAKTADYEGALHMYKEALKSDPKNQQARYNYELLLKKLQDRDQNSKNDASDSDMEENGKEDKQQSQSQGGNQQDRQQQKSGAGNDSEQTGSGRSDNGREAETLRGQNKGTEAGENISEADNVDNQEQGGAEAGEMPGEATTSQKLRQINMPEERARMLLNAMRDAERQYLQQTPRKQRARQQTNKPNW